MFYAVFYAVIVSICTASLFAILHGLTMAAFACYRARRSFA